MRNAAPLLALLLSGCPEGEIVDTGPIGGPPVAICESPEGLVQPLGREIFVDASTSTDPDGDVLVYEWTLAVKPEGSLAEMEDRDQAISRFTPDVEGEYGAFVTVFDSTGQFSEACRVAATVFVLPDPPREVDEDDGLRIELTWDNAGDDLDLHLLRPEDGTLEDADTSCYFANCAGAGPDWGAVGAVADDPLLIEDDIEGTGPEVMYLQEPGPGVFRAVMRDYPGNANGATIATMTVFWDGVEVATDERTFDDTPETEGLYVWSIDIDAENQTYTVVTEQPAQPE
ncbi:MAG: hypothetical protein ACJAZO_001347 [Myxococcota bacterium]|jgi:hypothetical protein